MSKCRMLDMPVMFAAHKRTRAKRNAKLERIDFTCGWCEWIATFIALPLRVIVVHRIWMLFINSQRSHQLRGILAILIRIDLMFHTAYPSIRPSVRLLRPSCVDRRYYPRIQNVNRELIQFKRLSDSFRSVVHHVGRKLIVMVHAIRTHEASGFWSLMFSSTKCARSQQ